MALTCQNDHQCSFIVHHIHQLFIALGIVGMEQLKCPGNFLDAQASLVGVAPAIFANYHASSLVVVGNGVGVDTGSLLSSLHRRVWRSGTPPVAPLNG